ncbi:cytidylyltransferase domain-containing protein [Candidatus Omnitrophota bacterium]
MKIIASIASRMSSTRLPGKVLMQIKGKPVLELMLERLRRSRLIDGIIVATTLNQADQAIVELCQKLKVNYYRGSEEDVLQRILEAQQSAESDLVVELTGDCPLIDPELIDQCIEFYLNHDYVYVSNCAERSYPDGMDVQVFSTKALEEVAAKTRDPLDREHVGKYFYTSGNYRIHTLRAEGEFFWPDLGITLDMKEDFELIKIIFEHFQDNNFNLGDILKFLRQNQHLLEINRQVARKGLS